MRGTELNQNKASKRTFSARSRFAITFGIVVEPMPFARSSAADPGGGLGSTLVGTKESPVIMGEEVPFYILPQSRNSGPRVGTC